MNKCLKVSPCVEIENWGVGMLSQGFSFKAVNIKNEIVGVLLNCYMTVEVIDSSGCRFYFSYVPFGICSNHIFRMIGNPAAMTVTKY